jgi:transposase
VDAQIKLSVVASDIFGVSGRAMLAALIAGERDPKVLAQLARTRLRAKLGPLAEAFTGCFTDQHAFLLGKLLARVNALDADLAELDAKLAELIGPFTDAVDRLDAIPGIGQLAAQLLIAEIGTDTGQVPDRRAPGVVGQVRPGVKESAGNRKGSGSTGHGNP